MLGLIRSLFAGSTDEDALSPSEASALLAAGEITLVDVREPSEWQQMRIPGALHAPLSTLQQELHQLPAEKPVVFYCVSGRRSAAAVALCGKSKQPRVRHMAGGLMAWRAKGLPVDP